VNEALKLQGAEDIFKLAPLKIAMGAVEGGLHYALRMGVDGGEHLVAASLEA